jgi:hypothetical protein
MHFIIALSMAVMAVASPMARHSPVLHQLHPRQNSTTSAGFNCASDQYSADQVKVSYRDC